MLEQRQVDFEHQCTITYENVSSPENGIRKRTASIVTRITQDEYQRIMVEAAKGIPIKEIEGISDTLEKMKENAIFIDRYMNLNNSFRKTPLSKPRQIKTIEFSLTESDRKRIGKMKDPEAVFSRPEEHMTIYRNDGSFVHISSEYGLVTIRDTNKKSQYVRMEADVFLSEISR